MFLKLKFTFILICSISIVSFGQSGLKISLFHPTGDIGPFFKKAPSYEIFFFNNEDNHDEWFRTKFGVNFTAPSPRLDSFPEFAYQGGNDPKFFPGVIVYNYFSMLSAHSGFDVKIMHIKRLYLYAGTSIIIGVATISFYREYQTILTENVHMQDGYGGIQFRATAEYEINDLFNAFVEATKSSIINQKISTTYGYYDFGIGISCNLSEIL